MKKILIVIAEYYPDISAGLKNSALKNLDNYKVDIINAPGAFEIPIIISKNISKYDAFIALGCIIMGETPHFDLISSSVMNGIMQLSINHKKPIGNGILTCLTKAQALARINKGIEASKAAIDLLENDTSK